MADGRLRYNMEFGGQKVDVVFTVHALERFMERGVQPIHILGALTDASSLTLAAESGEEIVICDWDRDITLVVAMGTYGTKREFGIVTMDRKGRDFRPKGAAVKIENGVASWLMAAV